MGNKKFVYLIIIVFALGIIIIASRSERFFSLNTAEVNQPQPMDIFTNLNGGYSFQYPSGWNAVINKYNNKNSLFGLNTNNESGLGGVEIFSNYSSIDKFVEGVEGQFTNRENIIIDGISGIKVHTKSVATRGQAIILLKDGNIYNIYVNSDDARDVKLFGQIVSTFKFVSSMPIQATYKCDGGKNIYAIFYKGELKTVEPGQPPIPNGSVKLFLSDKRNFDLAQTVSADGGRYSNNNESIIFWSKGDTAFINENSGTTFKDCLINNSDAINNNQISTGLANPASINCIKNGGTLEMRNNKKGQYGVCLFEDNKQCEEWALFHGQCPIGGLKITGYDNEAEVYCVITGGQVEGVGTITPMCKRIDGTYCVAQANLDGQCPDPNDQNPNSNNIEAL